MSETRYYAKSPDGQRKLRRLKELSRLVEHYGDACVEDFKARLRLWKTQHNGEDDLLDQAMVSQTEARKTTYLDAISFRIETLMAQVVEGEAE